MEISQKTLYDEYELLITADGIKSTDTRFTMDKLEIGDNYKPLNVYFENAKGEITERNYNKNERKISNQTMPRIAFQIFEKQISEMSDEDKENFPICKYNPNEDIICGIYSSVDEFKKQYRNSLEYMKYNCDNGRQFVIYCWNIFSTITFVQECLKRFGEQGDQFILTYRNKNMKDIKEGEYDNMVHQSPKYNNRFSSMLFNSKNLIFRGAPGTGKSFIAKKVATDIISNGEFDDYTLLTEEQKKQIEFVQFHPNYDYSDFVEGLRPKINDDGTMRFELQDGIFKKFVARARKNYENSQKSMEIIEKEISVYEAMTEFFSNIELGTYKFNTVNGNEFTITSMDDDNITIYIPKNAISNKLTLNLDDIRKMLESEQNFDKVKEITTFFGKSVTIQAYSYMLAIYKAINENKRAVSNIQVKKEELKNYIFIIDEINRGEISKIFGELFFSIDPGYRGKIGEISTQYSNMHPDSDAKFYIPDNLYIIGTMNDIDRSVDSFDFAMRRRFRFVEIRANEHLEMLDSLDNEDNKSEAIKRMIALNEEIANIEDLNENYQIGAAYFLKLNNLEFNQLWTDYLQPLLQEYIQGMYNEEEIMNRFSKAYGYKKIIEGNMNETSQN